MSKKSVISTDQEHPWRKGGPPAQLVSYKKDGSNDLGWVETVPRFLIKAPSSSKNLKRVAQKKKPSPAVKKK